MLVSVFSDGGTNMRASHRRRAESVVWGEFVVDGGADDRLIRELIALLTGAAKKTNIASGMPAQKINQLAVILKKVAGEQQQTQQGEGA